MFMFLTPQHLHICIIKRWRQIWQFQKIDMWTSEKHWYQFLISIFIFLTPKNPNIPNFKAREWTSFLENRPADSRVNIRGFSIRNFVFSTSSSSNIPNFKVRGEIEMCGKIICRPFRVYWEQTFHSHVRVPDIWNPDILNLNVRKQIFNVLRMF